ncbi:MAG: C39 family peptidase [Actinomycetota bacterium]|nr:C39 family peptidase [Actinomycetota bacterium]
MPNHPLPLLLVASFAAAALTATTPAATGTPPTTTSVTPASASVRPAQAVRPRAARHIAYQQWATPRRLRTGRLAGVRVTHEGVRMARPVGRRTHRGVRYAFGHWTSPWARPGFGLTEAIASWEAATARGTWVAVQMRGRTPAGRRSSWDSLGRWASHERRFRRATLGAQSDDLARVAVDTLQTNGRARFTRWQVRVTLYRSTGTQRTPLLRAVGAMASRLPGTDPRAGATRMTRTVDLAVPRRSQMVHRGHFPQWGGGGEAWCSPTSTTMLLGFWDRWPKPRSYRWVGSRHQDPEVDYAARAVYDYGFRGAGNWAFNVAYANRYRTRSFVTRLRTVREAERFIQAGIPLVASVRFGAGELDNAPRATRGGTNGHLLVIRGFTADGRVIANDPAAANNRGVRRVYRRGQFADAWVGGSGGVVYVIRPEGRALPRRTTEANW